MEGRCKNVVGMPGKHLARAAVDRPHSHSAVLTTRCEPTTIRAKGCRPDETLMAAQTDRGLMSLRIHDDHTLVIRRSYSQPAAIGAVRQGSAFAWIQPFTGLNIVDVHVGDVSRERSACYGQSASVRTDRHEAEPSDGDLDFL